MQTIKEFIYLTITAVFFAGSVYLWSLGCGETFVDSTGENRQKECRVF